MSSRWIVVVGAVLLLVAALALFSRKSVRAEVVIQAEPSEIWAMIVDPASYPDWNPIFVSVNGTYDEGATLDVDMKSPDGSISAVQARVKTIVLNSELNQVGGMPGLLTFDHTWTLKEVDGGTRVTQFEEYRGIGVLFWDPAWVEEAYRQANQNLKERVEP